MKGLSKTIAKWQLVGDGAPFRTTTSWLQPVLAGGVRAMLKVPVADEERAGIAVLAWFDGIGAARVLRADHAAVLMERLADDVSLTTMAERDDEGATRILCDVIAVLHRPRGAPPPLMTMRTRFGSLANAAEASGPHRAIFSRAWDMARGLLAAPAELVVLHGDMHHRNVLHDPARGWVAIDPKGVLGNRALEYATIFYNPTDAVAHRPGRLRASARLVAAVAGINEREILQWAFTNAALSACWSIESGRPATSALTTAGIIEAELVR